MLIIRRVLHNHIKNLSRSKVAYKLKVQNLIYLSLPRVSSNLAVEIHSIKISRAFIV